MKCKDIMALVKAGKFPVVRVTGELWEEAWGQIGMIGKITRIEDPKDNTFHIWFDFSIAPEHNLALQSHDWWIDSMAGTRGTAIEAGMRKEDDLSDDAYFDPDQELPFELVEDEDSPLMIYLRWKAGMPGMTKTYVEWLEDQFKSLVHEHLHPTAEEAGKMNREELLGMMESRIIKTAHIAETFENAGVMGGNGFHFAQKLGAHARKELESRLKDTVK